MSIWLISWRICFNTFYNLISSRCIKQSSHTKNMKITSIVWAFCFGLIAQHNYSQSVVSDKEISKMVAEVSANNMESTVRKLVSFGTRHTLSDTKSTTRGIGAAQRWVKAEFDKYAKDSNGRLTAQIDYFTVSAKRINSALYPSSSLDNPSLASFFISSEDLLGTRLESLNFNPNQATAVLNLKSSEELFNRIDLFSITFIISILLSPSGFLYRNFMVASSSE